MRPVDSRPVSGSGLAAALDLLTPPFAAGAGLRVLPLTDGTVDVPALRAPVVLVRLTVPLARRAVVVRCRAAGGGAEQPAAVFTAWSAAGSLLPLFLPQPPADTSGPIRLAVTVRTADGAPSADPAAAIAAAGPDLPSDEAAALVEVLAVEGRLARLVHLLTAEKQRLTAVAREIAASRHVSLARSGALDAIGADHGVPRLEGEGDEAYRGRLLIVTSWRLATPAGFDRALNGPPEPTAGGGPNRGLPATVGITARFRIVERSDQPAVSVRLVEVVPPPADGPSAWRHRFVELASGGLLLDLDGDTPAGLPDSTRSRLEQTRQILTGRLTRDQPHDDRRYLGAGTATCLARAVLLLEVLTGPGTLTLRSAMTTEADPRFDLGLGVAVDPPTADRVDRAVEAARAAQQAAAAGGAVLPGAAPDVVGAVLGAAVRDRTDDPQARWLFAAAGLDATPLDDGTLQLTSLPGHGLVIEGPARLAEGETGQYVARMRGAGSGRSVLVDEAWARALTGFGPAVAEVPPPLEPADLATLLGTVATAAPAVPAAARPLVAAGLVPAVPGEFAARVREAYDTDLLLGLVVPTGLAGLAADAPAAVAARDTIRTDVAVLTAAGFVSVRVLPHPDGSSLLVLGSVGLLPGGSNLPGEPVPATYRWYVAPFPPPAPDRPVDAAEGLRSLTSGSVDTDWSFRLGGPRLRRPRRWTPAPLEVRRGVGGRVELLATRPGIALVVCVAHTRRGLADPYEVRLELPDDAVLDLHQYGYLMNLLEELCPLGIEVNTFPIRRDHVSPDGGPPQFLAGELSRTYTRYRRRRGGGAERYGPPPD